MRSNKSSKCLDYTLFVSVIRKIQNKSIRKKITGRIIIVIAITIWNSKLIFFGKAGKSGETLIESGSNHDGSLLALSRSLTISQLNSKRRECRTFSCIIIIQWWPVSIAIKSMWMPSNIMDRFSLSCAAAATHWPHFSYWNEIWIFEQQ